MVITVTCWSCSTTFPVDTDKIPVGGVNARCSSCGDIFRVEHPDEEAAPAPPRAEAEPAAEAWSAPVEDTWTGQTEAEESSGPDLADPMALPAEPDEPFFAPPEPEPEPEPEPLPQLEAQPEAEAPAVSGFSFGKRDPKDRARRLARVLVSDMISYNPERHERALANGSLKADFEEEIEKSWKEFVEQVGEEMANENSFWTEALNDVLAKGEQIF